MIHWKSMDTEDKIEAIRAVWKPGSSSSMIAAHFGGATRSAVIAMYNRHYHKLLDWPLPVPKRTEKVEREERTVRSPEERAEWRRQYNRAYAARKRSSAVIIKFPTATRNVPSYSPQKSKPALRVVSNNISLMVQDWLEKNGGPRRFPARQMTDSMTIQDFLAERGVKLKAAGRNWGVTAGRWNISSGPGRPKTLTWAGVMEFVDDLRIAEGLAPFAANAAFGALSRSRGDVG